MSEETTTGTENTQTPAAAAPASGNSQQAAPAPEIPVEEIANAIKNKVVPVLLRQAREEVTGSILKTLGAPDSNVQDEQNAAFREKLDKDPIGTIAAVMDHTRKETLREVAEREAEEDHKKEERRKVNNKLLKDREDIITNEHSVVLLDGFYEKADPKLTHEDKMKWAINQHDLMLEKAGAGTVEDRRKAATVSSSASAGGGSSSAAPQRKSFDDLTRSSMDSQKQRIEQYKKTHGGRYPSTVR